MPENPFGKNPDPPKDENPFGKNPDPKPKERKTVLGFGRNVIKSSQNFIGGMGNALIHPVQSIKTLTDAVDGAQMLITGVRDDLKNDPDVQRKMTTARTIAEMYAERYGGLDAALDTMYKDPVGFLADVTTVLAPAQGPIRAQSNALRNSGNPAARVAGATLRTVGTPDVLTAPMNVVDFAGNLGTRAADYTYNTIMDPKGATYRRAVDTRGQEVLNALNNPNNQIVPGSLPTAAEAASPAGATRFSAMGDAAREALPDAYYQRQLQQNDARLNQVRQVGQTPADLQNAENLRGAASTFNYNIANQAAIPLDQRFQRIAGRPAVHAAIREAQISAANAGEHLFNGQGQLTGRGAHLIKLALDDAITPNPTTANARNANRAIEAARREYLDWLEDRNPQYRMAREAHRRMSIPINQMQVGQYLEGRLIPALGEDTAAIRAINYANALEDAPGTIRRALTDRPRFETLDQILTPQQMQQVQSVHDDLARVKVTEQQVRAAKASGPNPMRVGGETIGGIRAPNLINIITSASNKLMQIAQGRIDQRMAIEIATEMLDPRLAAQVLERALTRRNNLVNRAGRATATVGRGASRIMHTPAIYNVLSPESQEAQYNALRNREPL